MARFVTRSAAARSLLGGPGERNIIMMMIFKMMAYYKIPWVSTNFPFFVIHKLEFAKCAAAPEKSLSAAWYRKKRMIRYRKYQVVLAVVFAVHQWQSSWFSSWCQRTHSVMTLKVMCCALLLRACLSLRFSWHHSVRACPQQSR